MSERNNHLFDLPSIPPLGPEQSFRLRDIIRLTGLSKNDIHNIIDRTDFTSPQPRDYGSRTVYGFLPTDVRLLQRVSQQHSLGLSIPESVSIVQRSTDFYKNAINVLSAMHLWHQNQDVESWNHLTDAISENPDFSPFEQQVFVHLTQGNSLENLSSETGLEKKQIHDLYHSAQIKLGLTLIPLLFSLTYTNDQIDP